MDIMGKYLPIIEYGFCTFRVALLMIQKYTLKVGSIAIESDFLNGKLKGNEHKKITKGYLLQKVSENHGKSTLKIDTTNLRKKT
jgi:hypothetical protein